MHASWQVKTTAASESSGSNLHLERRRLGWRLLGLIHQCRRVCCFGLMMTPMGLRLKFQLGWWSLSMNWTVPLYSLVSFNWHSPLDRFGWYDVQVNQWKSPKTNTLADGLIERTSSMLDEIASKTVLKRKVTDWGKEVKHRMKESQDET